MGPLVDVPHVRPPPPPPKRAAGLHPLQGTRLQGGVGGRDDARWRAKTKRTDRARTCCLFAFRGVQSGGRGGENPGAVLMGKTKGIPNANRNEQSWRHSPLHVQDTDKAQDHKSGIEQWLAVGGGWRLAVGGGWQLAVGGGRRLAIGGWWRLAVPRGCP